ncbi:hypothetical protein RHO12_06095 [Orbus sturtevantii]
MIIDELQNKIDETKYWDLLILDLQVKYFGDEIYLFIEKNDNVCWKISFLSCYKVNYQTDANWRGNFRVKDTGPKSGYYGQDITVKKYETDTNFIETSLDLSIMTVKITCKNILVEEVELKDTTLFWE